MAALGTELREKICKLAETSIRKNDSNAFWMVLRDIAKEDIIQYGDKVDSDVIIPLYYQILSENTSYIPDYFQEILPSNGQERYRVLIRNLFSSNAFHPDGLANQDGIHAYKEINESKKGERIVFEKE